VSHRILEWIVISAAALLMTARAAEISGKISTTMTLTEDSVLKGDVTCTVTGAACIVLNAPSVTLNLNGYMITGQGDPQTGCSGGATGGEAGIVVNSQVGVSIQGPGVVQRFRNSGILINTSSGTTVNGVTTAMNCLSGILVAGGAANELSNNISIANGNGSNACGGI